VVVVVTLVTVFNATIIVSIVCVSVVGVGVGVIITIDAINTIINIIIHVT
jgi:hypothetical protein